MEGYIEKLGTQMTFLNTKRDVISNNIANANTPNFKAQDVIFREQLEKSAALYKPNIRHGGTDSKLYQTNERHIPVSANNQIQFVNSKNKVNDDGNNVDVTVGMIELMKVTHLQSFIVNAVNKQSSMNSAARGN